MLYARNESAPLNAASNVKLVTSAAALSRLGPEYRWRTVVYGPTLRRRPPVRRRRRAERRSLPARRRRSRRSPAEDLSALAMSLASQGLKRVRGALVIDASAFEGGSLGPGYEQKNETAAYRAPSSAASLNANAVLVTVIPGPKPGAPARITVDPPSPYFAVNGRIITAGLTGPAIPMVETGDLDEQTRITLSGRIRVGSEPRPFLRRVVHPELFLGHTFREILKHYGITIDKPLRIGTVPAEGFRTLATHDSPSLAVVLHDLNKRSSNFAAEQVLRTLGGEVVGRPGSWDKGLEAVARHLEALGIPRNSYRMSNGSGLYDSNRFTAEQTGDGHARGPARLPHRQRVPRLAGGGGHRRHPGPAHGRHPRPPLRARQDRHPGQRQQPLRRGGRARGKAAAVLPAGQRRAPTPPPPAWRKIVPPRPWCFISIPTPGPQPNRRPGTRPRPRRSRALDPAGVHT